jgi:RNA polymerase sigma-70 factor (ECF subfamily)
MTGGLLLAARPGAGPAALDFAGRPARPGLEDTAVSVEHELVAAALDGDGESFAALVRPHLGLLHRVSLRACGDAALAQDAVQEALTLAYQSLGRYQPGTSLKAFLAAIAVKRAHTLLRGERRRRARENEAPPPAGEATPAEMLSAARAAERVRAALRQLPEKQRTVALLRLDAGLDYAEIAAVARTTEGSARVLVHRALATLRAALGELLEPEPME